MRLLSVLLLILSLACKTTPDADANASSPRPSSRSAPAHGTGAEFDDAGAGAGDGMQLAVAPRARAATPSESKSSFDSRTPVDDAAQPMKREVVYTAYLRVIVAAVEDAMRSVETLAEKAGGYLEHSSARSIRIRVPAERFDGAIEGIESLGEVVDRAITASDVTEEVLDLNIRLDNARKTRERLLAHLAVSKKIGDTLKIEAEISRVSETIEQLEGKLRTMRSQIAMSTISVDWSAQSPQPTATTAPLVLPFPWIEELGDGLVAGEVEPTTRKPGLLERELRFEPPQNFIRYYATRDRV
ncbi:DUF4349 domain-containing protein, partial [Myxococcota bacterium]|nr:DUF4349 domain-containing protein [Myxococcota bacterium]